MCLFSFAYVSHPFTSYQAGLYVFGRASLFANCYELAPTFNILLKKSQKLELVMGERYDTMIRAAGEGLV
jgi:hypothetical protein